VNEGTGLTLAGWRDRLLLGFEEVARLLDVSTRTVRRLVAMGELARPVKVRKSSRLRVSDIEVYLQRITAKRDGKGEAYNDLS
jgi:excisionase family DNA binding protein